jgi:hypothetical protein
MPAPARCKSSAAAIVAEPTEAFVSVLPSSTSTRQLTLYSQAAEACIPSRWRLP